MIIEELEIEELYYFDWCYYTEDQWNDILRKGEIDGEEIDPEEAENVKQYRVIRCPICSDVWSNIDDFDGLNPCEHLLFWFCEDSFNNFGGWDSKKLEKDYIDLYREEEGLIISAHRQKQIDEGDEIKIEDCFSREDILEKITCHDVDVVYSTGSSGIACGPVMNIQFWGVKKDEE